MGRSCHGSPGHEDNNTNDIDPLHVETVYNLPREGQKGKDGQAERQADPWEKCNVTEGLV